MSETSRSTARPKPSSLQETTGASEPGIFPGSEMEAAYRESEDLLRRGTPEDVVAARLEKRLQAQFDKFDADMAEKLSKLSAAHAATTKHIITRQYRLSAMVAVLGVVGGSLLELTIGDQFVFSASGTYRAGVPWVLALMAPPLTWMLLRAEWTNHGMAVRYPTWWVRWLFVFPLTVAIASAMLAVAPLGWFALYGRLSGTPVVGVEAKILTVAPLRTNERVCGREAEILIKGSSANICLAKVLSGKAPVAGETVVVSGRISLAGVFIDKVTTK